MRNINSYLYAFNAGLCTAMATLKFESDRRLSGFLAFVAVGYILLTWLEAIISERN